MKARNKYPGDIVPGLYYCEAQTKPHFSGTSLLRAVLNKASGLG